MGHTAEECLLVKVGDTGHIAFMCDCLQGCGVQVQPAEAGSPSFSAAINRVLTDSQYTKAAQALSKKLRARKNTPVEEAAGASSLSHRWYAINRRRCSKEHVWRSASAFHECSDSMSAAVSICQEKSKPFSVEHRSFLCRSH